MLFGNDVAVEREREKKMSVIRISNIYWIGLKYLISPYNKTVYFTLFMTNILCAVAEEADTASIRSYS